MELIVILYQHYGLLIIFAVAFSIAIVWLITHLVSEKGTEVSMLFGLVKYTKQKKSQSFFDARER